MTHTSSATSPRAPRSIAAALATLGVVAALAAPSGAAAVIEPPEPPLSFTASAGGFGIVDPEGTLTLTAAAVNPAPTVRAGGSVTFSVGPAPLTSPGEVSEWLDEGADHDLTPLGDATMATLSANAENSTALSVDVADTALAGAAPGVYPLRAAYTSPAGDLVSDTVVVVPAADRERRVGVVLPITAGPLATGLLTADQLGALTAPDGALRARLNAALGTGAILAIDPAIPAAIRVLGTDAPASATQWLDDLTQAPNERFALQFGDADITVQFSAGFDALLSAPTLDPYLRSDATPTPDAATLATAAAYDIGPSRADVYWPADGTAGPDTLAALSALAPQGQNAAPLVVVPSSTVAGDAGDAYGEAAGADLLVYLSEASASLSAAAAGALTRGADLAAASAYLHLAAGDGPLLVALDRNSTADETTLRAAITAATALPGARSADLATLTAGSPAARTVREVEPVAERVETLLALDSDRAPLARFATVLENPALITAAEQAETLQLMGTGWADDAAAWREAVSAHRAQTRETLRSVEIIPPADITLLGSSAPLQFTVRNDLPWPVSVVMLATPNDPRLRVQAATEVEAGPQRNTRADVPVEARVGTGESTIVLQLRSRAMVSIGDPITAAVSVRAEWETVGVVAVSAIAALLLVMGVIRTARRVRARRAAAASSGGADG
ncbi:DUF6049 family protein [Microbacterium sp.]|uniref:DUF6049 family protein n=1 Tax=Microbacterium sp. TaxID=51671 RepID=UPI003A8AF13F